MITQQQKKVMNVAIPAIVAGMAAVFAYRYTKKWEITLGATALAFLLAWAITARITKEAVKAKPKDTDVNGSGAYGEDYDPTALTDALYDDLKPQFINWSRDIDSFKKLLALNSIAFRKVHNDWNKRYYPTIKESLAVAIANEGTFLQFDEFADHLKKQLSERFITEGLN
ncbi:MAG: hypothetical protein EBX41_02000 [Chitinophagia bacterium]|nr:hypothetical protein [Chitinophagia bacterium]